MVDNILKIQDGDKNYINLQTSEMRVFEGWSVCLG